MTDRGVFTRGRARIRGRAIGFVLFSLMLMLIALITSSSASVTELDVCPQVIVQGETVTISGKASPDNVWLTTSFEMSLPVMGGNYNVEFNGINFPGGEKEFSIRVEHIKNAKIKIYPIEAEVGGWSLTFPLTAICDGERISIAIPGVGEVLNNPLEITDGSLTFSRPFPMTLEGIPYPIDLEGEKDYIRISGEATDGATSVNVEQSVGIKTSVENGNFALDVDTSGIPAGAFQIEAGEGGMNREVFITSSLPTLSLSADESDITVGDTVIITAQLKNQEGDILQEGIFIDFNTAAGTLSDSHVMTDASGRASTSLTAVTAGIATVCAYCDDIKSQDISLVFSALPTPTPSPTPTSNPSSNGGNGGDGSDGSSTSDSTPSPSPSPSASPSPSPTSTATPATTAAPAPVTPTATATSIPSPTPSPSPSSSKRWIPGFDAVFTITGLLAVAYLVLRKRRE